MALPPAVRDSLIVNRILHGSNAAPLPGSTGPGHIPPAVAAKFAAIQAAQAAARSVNPDDGAAQIVAGVAAGMAGEPADAHPQPAGITGLTGVNDGCAGNGVTSYTGPTEPVAEPVTPRVKIDGGYIEAAGEQFPIESATIEVTE